MPDEKPDEIEVKLSFRIPPRMPSLYAHHMFIQPGQNEVVLSFFEVIPPIFTEEQAGERLKMLQEAGIVAECVARITVANAAFPAFLTAIEKVTKQIAAREQQEKRETQDANS